jgi:hypothetical protein
LTETVTRFAELPRITDQDDLYSVHRTDGLYYVKRGGLAHARADCGHLEPEKMVDKSAWRVATDSQRQALGIDWCEDCC